MRPEAELKLARCMETLREALRSDDNDVAPSMKERLEKSPDSPERQVQPRRLSE